MRRSVTAWILCAGIGWTGEGRAAPPDGAGYQRAMAADDGGDPETALRIIDDELGAAPAALPLLRLKGKVLIELGDLAGAHAAFQAFLAAGATGKDAREAQQTMLQLEPALTTFLDITVDGAEETGPVDLYLDSPGGRPLCSAAPSCHTAMLPRDYRLLAVAQRPGFARWDHKITVDGGQTTSVRIALAPLPSTLTVTASPPGAQIAVDGAPYAGPAQVPAGKHHVVVSRSGYVKQDQEITASAGDPVTVAVALVRLVPVRVQPSSAALALDGVAIEVIDGGVAIPPGAHALVASTRGFRDHRVDIPAGRPPDYRIDVELAPVAVAATVAPVTATPLPATSLEARPLPRDAGRSPTAAFLLSFGGTAASWGVVVAAAAQPKGSDAMWTYGAIGATAMVFGPSVGRWYAHKVGARGIALRFLSVVLATGFVRGCNWASTNDCGTDVLAAGLVSAATLYVAGTLDDLASAPDDARNYRQPAPIITVAPMLRGDRGGLTLTGQF